MKILSPITHHTIGSRNLKKTFLKYGYDFEFVGVGCKWEVFIKSKIQKILEYLQDCKDDIYCVIDGYDMLACNYPSELVKRFLSFNTPIIFGGEKFCFSYNAEPVLKYKNICLWKARKYLNSGFYIGKRDNLIEMCKWAISVSKKLGIDDDQKIFCMYANTFSEKVAIDIYQKIIFNTITSLDTNNFKKKDNCIYIKSFSSYPCFIHFPSIKSDGCERYNKYGKAILGDDFFPMFSEKSWNLFANIPMYVLFFLFILVSIYLRYGLKGCLTVFLTVFLISKFYINY